MDKDYNIEAKSEGGTWEVYKCHNALERTQTSQDLLALGYHVKFAEPDPDND